MSSFLCAIIKDEHADIREWVVHHQALGIDYVVLYDNDSQHGYDAELGDLGVELRAWPGNADYRQRHVYDHFVSSRAWRDDDWCLFIDADEFLHLADHDNIAALIADYTDYAGVVLSWQCYGANRHILRPPGPVRAAYTEPTPLIRDRHNFKSLARLSEISFWADVHRFVPKHRQLVTVHHQPVTGSNIPQLLSVAWIDHYITKSWEDYVARLRRGNITKGIRRIDHFFAYNPDMEHLAGELTARLDVGEFPTLFNDRQRERNELHDALNAITERLDQASEFSDARFGQCCVFELLEICNLHLNRIADETERERLRPQFYELLHKQIANLNSVPRDTAQYHDVIISTVISTPFERLAREV